MTTRDIASDAPPSLGGFVENRRVVAVIGIDRYLGWPALDNAVSDAMGALAAFERIGFEQITRPLLDEAASAEAIRRLVTDDLATLGGDDSLVLFFAGHGHTQTRTLPTGPLQTGYIIPFDGDGAEGRTASWIRLDSWLSDVARIPARHILVILDACHSGIALGSLIKWRGGVSARLPGALDELRRRQSRRVITSALGDQRAMDSGPISGHSLFTGCLIEGLSGGLARDDRTEATGSELGVYVQQRVTGYTGSRQTPDFGTLELDDRGELVLALAETGPPPLRTSMPVRIPAAHQEQGAPGPIVVPAANRQQDLRSRTTRVAPAETSAPEASENAPASPFWDVEFMRRTAAPLPQDPWDLARWPRYKQILVTIAALILFSPAGIGLAWWFKLWSKRTRIIASTASAILFIAAIVSLINDMSQRRKVAANPSDTAIPISSAEATRPAAVTSAPQPLPVGGAGVVERVDPETGKTRVERVKTAEVAVGEAAWDRARRSRNGQVMVRREDFGEAWPFTVESGTITCAPPHIIAFHASDGRVFGVNGVGIGKHGKIDPIWADDPSSTGRELQVKRSIEPILALGLFLCKQSPQ